MIRPAVAAGALLILSLAPAARQEPGDDERQLRALVREWDAAYTSRDTSTLDRILADDYVMTDASGAGLSKMEYLRAMVKSPDISRAGPFESSDVVVTIAGAQAVVSGRSPYKGRPRGRPALPPAAYRFTDRWEKRDGRWVAVSSQAARVAP